jgi:heat shock protein HslJ
MSQEGMMFQVLNGTAAYSIDGDTLTITKDGTTLVFTAGSFQ